MEEFQVQLIYLVKCIIGILALKGVLQILSTQKD